MVEWCDINVRRLIQSYPGSGLRPGACLGVRILSQNTGSLRVWDILCFRIILGGFLRS